MHGNIKKIMSNDKIKIAIIGAGSFGLSLGYFFDSYGFDISIWGHDKKKIEEIKTSKENKYYLPGVIFSENIKFYSNLNEVIADAKYIMIMDPTQYLRNIFKKIKKIINKDQVIIIGSKGIEIKTLSPIYHIVEEIFDDTTNITYMSGPTFAREIASKIPTACVVASKDISVAENVQKVFSNDSFRFYTSNDIIGVNVGGALKNVIAIASGITDGMGLGLNSRAAIITRGLAEITRLGVDLGANPLTFQGLAGIGDLVLTCTGGLSRNRSVGIRLGKGERWSDISASMNMVAEGIYTAKAAYELSKKLQVEMPITEVVYKIIYEDMFVKEAVLLLMGRKLKSELYGIKKG